MDEQLNFIVEQVGHNKSRATVTISQEYVESLYNHILRSKQSRVVTQGFMQGDTPLAYLECTFKNNIIEHLKELLFNHCVVNYLYQKLMENHLHVSGEPTVHTINLDPRSGASYVFEFIQAVPPIEQDWRRLPFRAPTRKNYKDIDRQVEFFLEEEHKRQEAHTDTIMVGDWVLLELQLVNSEGTPLLRGHAHESWLKLGDEVIDQDAYALLHEKKCGDKFVTTNDLLQEYVNNNFDIKYHIQVTIKERVPFSHFSVDHFKKQFRLKSQRETHNKLIEVFSYRNDVSQRRETVEATLKLLLARYPFNAPEHLTKKQMQLLLKEMQSNPDYNVYRRQTDFKEKVRMLAQKLVKEQILINHLAVAEKTEASNDDVVVYLNLTKRPRTKEFIHFDVPHFKAQGHETPLPHELVRYYCMHEKTLNSVINNLTKRA